MTTKENPQSRQQSYSVCITWVQIDFAHIVACVWQTKVVAHTIVEPFVIPSGDYNTTGAWVCEAFIAAQLIHIGIVITEPDCCDSLRPPIILGQDVDHSQICWIFHGIVTHIANVDVRCVLRLHQVEREGGCVNHSCISELLDQIRCGRIRRISG